MKNRNKSPKQVSNNGLGFTSVNEREKSAYNHGGEIKILNSGDQPLKSMLKPSISKTMR